MILHILDAQLAGPTAIKVRFNDGHQSVIDLLPLLNGPMFEPLRAPDAFAQFTIDPVCKTIVWPNGADLAPEAVRNLALAETENAG